MEGVIFIMVMVAHAAADVRLCAGDETLDLQATLDMTMPNDCDSQALPHRGPFANLGAM